MEKEKLLLQKKNLVEKMGVYLENHDNMAPLEARIFATLILIGNNGITFERLVDDLSASKSTICTHLNTLQAAGRANYFTKTGDRKRYFTVIPNRLIQVMDEMLQKWEEQQLLHKEMLDFKKLLEQEDPEPGQKDLDLQFHEDYLQFLEEVSLSVVKFKEKISKKQVDNEYN